MTVKAPMSMHGLMAGKRPGEIIFQFLDQCLEEFKKVRGTNRLSFVTQEDLNHSSVLTGHPRMQKACMILWFDRDYVDKMMTLEPPEGIPGEALDPLLQIQNALRQLQELGMLKDDSPLEQQPTLATLRRELDRILGPLE